jgi:hypothetical protein
VSGLNWEAARLRDLVRDRGVDPSVSRVKPLRSQPAKRRPRRRPRAGRNARREQLAMLAARSDWPARADTEAWVRAELGEAVWREIEDAMSKQRPA